MLLTYSRIIQRAIPSRFRGSRFASCVLESSNGLKEYSDKDVAILVSKELVRIPNFVSEEEESNLISELDPSLTRVRYQTSHWDSAITEFRETERRSWRKVNAGTIDRLRTVTLDMVKAEKAPPGAVATTDFSCLLPLIHILDLAPSGWIKPHVDSIRYCGGVVVVLSLLSDSIARFAVAPASEVAAPTELLPASEPGILLPPPGAFADFFVPRRSVYVMRGVTRYRLTHSILPSPWELEAHGTITRSRRVTVICRSHPHILPNETNDVNDSSYRYGSLDLS